MLGTVTYRGCILERSGSPVEEGILLNELPMMTDEVLPQSHILTEEDDREMNETLARESFGVSLGEFSEAWKHGT